MIFLQKIPYSIDQIMLNITFNFFIISTVLVSIFLTMGTSRLRPLVEILASAGRCPLKLRLWLGLGLGHKYGIITRPYNKILSVFMS